MCIALTARIPSGSSEFRSPRVPRGERIPDYEYLLRVFTTSIHYEYLLRVFTTSIYYEYLLRVFLVAASTPGGTLNHARLDGPLLYFLEALELPRKVQKRNSEVSCVSTFFEPCSRAINDFID